MKTVMSAAVSLSMLLLGSGTTWAADMCFLDRDFGNLTVGKNFSFPAAGACKTFTGYVAGSDTLVSGAACGTSDQGLIRFNLDYSAPDGRFGVFVFNIERFNADLDRSGSGYFTIANAGNGGSWAVAEFHVKTIVCPSPRNLK